ncbi:MAG: TerC/Alx family metal homeostasis membrane protein [Leclercia sp.]|uniref:Putative membrane-bound redox modulator Alx n=1 Tax=Silvania hatchlandensis TaxID=2926469 RepID=A0A9J6PXJ8_9ENTR|nr:TerC/Alx family metal homeostasis membrane protein [Silvania hatchlandensis]MCU6665055.1 TerC/Alx family metal homeostasis membrane protein [Silvania hatchlandensis]
MASAHLGFPTETVVVFVVMAVGAMFIDLFMHRHNKPISLKSASLWSIFWVMTAMAFAGFLYVHHGAEVASLFLTGYALEEVLSVDNLFVMMAIFAWFGVPDQYRHRVLYWGVIGAIVFRGIFVAIGTSLLSLGPYVEVVFALIVAWTAVMMLKRGEEQDAIEDYSQHLAYRAVKRFYPIWPKITGHAFLLSQKEVDVELAKPENQDVMVGRVKKAKRYATPLLLCVAVVELSDVMFAFDSVPAIIAVSREPLIIYSAMMFAILGLRTLYFVLEALKQYLVHLEKAVIALLFFVAFKLGLNATDHFWHHGYGIGATASLLVVLGVLAAGIVASLLFPGKREA